MTQSPDDEAEPDYGDESDEEVEDKESDTKTGSGGSGGGGGVSFEETETEFDAAELQGMSLSLLRVSLKKGLKLVSRLTKQVEHELRGFLPDISLRARVLEMTFSERGHRTLLLDKGEIVQYQHAHGKLQRVRVSPDLDAAQAVRYAMAGFLAAGESIDPKDVKFGQSPEFRARMMPIWTQEWHKIQQQERQPRLGFARKDARFGQSLALQSRREPVLSSQPQAPRQGCTTASRIDLPRAPASRQDPQP